MLLYRRPKLELADESAIREIHQTSLRILEEVGVVFENGYVRDILADAPGVRVDHTTGRAYFEPATVEQLVRCCPSQFTLVSRNPARPVTLGGDFVNFAPVGSCAYVSDLVRGRRPGTLADLVELLKISQALPGLDITGGAICQPGDVPPALRSLHIVYASLCHTDRPVFGSLQSYEMAKLVIEMVRLARGGDSLSDRPGLLTVLNPLSPLCFGEGAAGALVAYAEERQPVVIAPTVIGGMNGPVTLAGALALQNAEVLAGVALSQIVHRGTPMVYGGVTTVGDMRQGGSPFGSPESALATVLTSQLARFYNLPSRGGGCLTDAKEADLQSGYERMMLLMVSIQAGIHFVYHAAGMLESFAVASYEQLVADADVIGYLTTLFGGLDLTPSTLALDVIAQVGPKGSFLTTDHTYDHFRESLFEPLVADRRQWPAWEADGRRSATERAYDVWNRLLAESTVEPLDPAVDRELRRMIAHHEKALAAAPGN